MYKLVSVKDTYTEQEYRKGIVKISDNTWIPEDPANTDYQAYLDWVAEGNTPEPADEELA